MLSAEVNRNVREPEVSGFDFGRIAERYEQWYSTRRGRLYDRSEKRAIDRLLAGVGRGKLLEVGCGTGHWSEYFSEKGFEVTGIDISEEMINAAKARQIRGSRFEVADGANLPFDDGEFEVGAAITSLEFTRSPEGILSEMVRCVSKPGGRLIVGALNSRSSYNLKRKNRPGSAYSSAHFFSPDELYELLCQFGSVQVLIAGFVWQSDWLLRLSALYEFAGGVMHSNRGAFIAARVDL